MKYFEHKSKQTHKTSPKYNIFQSYPTAKLLLNQIKHSLKYQHNLTTNTAALNLIQINLGKYQIYSD